MKGREYSVRVNIGHKVQLISRALSVFSVCVYDVMLQGDRVLL